MTVMFGLGYSLLGSLAAAAGVDVAMLLGFGFRDNYPRWIPFCMVFFCAALGLFCVLFWINSRMFTRKGMTWRAILVEVFITLLLLIPCGMGWLQVFAALRFYI